MEVNKVIGEEELANLCSKGDILARKELYTKYAAWLTMICSRYADSSVEAKDLMHDSMVEVFRSIKNFEYRGNGSLRAWIRSIAVNTAIDKKRKHFFYNTIDLQDIQNEIAYVHPDEADSVPLSVLKTMISELPETKRVIFCLYCIEGFSHRQISDRLGITENASSSMLSKAKRTLASKIKAYLKKEENHR